MKILALDYGGSAVKYALCDENAAMERSGKAPAPLDSAEQFRERTKEIYDLFRGEAEGIAMSFPGYIDPDQGILMGSGVYEPILKGKNLIEIVQSVCPVPVSVENDGKAGALAEAWRGELSGVNDGAVMILGSGIAGGIIKDRRAHYGKGFAAGELSYLLTGAKCGGLTRSAALDIGAIGMAAKACAAKNLDPDVQDASAAVRGTMELFRADFPDAPKGTPVKIKADARQIFAWAAEGDPDAVKIRREFMEALAVMVFNTQVIFAPEKIVIGGGISRAEGLLSDLSETLGRYYEAMGVPDLMRSSVALSSYGQECNLLGAVYSFLLRNGRL